MQSTMPDYPLTIAAIFRHGRTIYGDSDVVSMDGGERRVAEFALVASRAEQLAAALARLGVRPGDRVATLGWNTQSHLEAYLAVPSMGAVLHTANLRLFPDELVYTITHAGDKVILADVELVPMLASLLPRMPCVEKVIVMGQGDTEALPEALRYDALLDAETPRYEWPELDERAPAIICYTSGTTGEPKGVVYSHRSIYLHSLALISAAACAFTEYDRVLPVVPMFHANAWGLPYAAWLVGADLILPGRNVQAEALCRLISTERPTFAAAVPTVWSDVLRYSETAAVTLESLRMILCGGAALPRVLLEQFEKRHDIAIIQAWGMTETGPVGALAFPPKHRLGQSELEWRARTGRVVPGMELRIVGDDGALPWDGAAVGEIQVRGPWVTTSYYGSPSPDKFDDGWLRTGDIGTAFPNGFIQITDRAKDVIKSGGEWISSVELESALMAHPDVVEASVIGVPDPRWTERPLACVVKRPGSRVTADELRTFLSSRVARWWLPERWSFVSEIPKTSVGKFDKKVLRARQAAGSLDVLETR
jgi:fatty-acyl-CoA synthase